ncbi:MAG: bifunctional UDP-N-acetylglucosamine diphosphorylase/glucosamine-1-phosphate N-acetyltransferase GlmU [Bacillota bacterium]
MNCAIVLAAGQGTRMKSKLPKVLHKVAGIPMLGHVLNTLEGAQICRKILVLGHGAKEIEENIKDNLQVVYQWEQLGTGHAVMQAEKLIGPEDENVLVVCGDTPLLQVETLNNLLQKHQETDAVITVLTSIIKNPRGYGRIIRRDNLIKAIVEEKDANEEQRAVNEINTGTYCFKGDFLKQSLSRLSNRNSQKEYYLTDLIGIAVENGLRVEGYILEDIRESLGINNKIQLAEAEKIMRLRVLERCMLEGVTIIDPDTTFIDGRVRIGADTIINPGTIIEGNSIIGEDCVIGPGVRVTDSIIGKGSNVQNSVILESIIGQNCKIGPFAYLRPGSELKDNVKIGDFVEIKKSIIGIGSKVPHLSYIGDSYIGENVNIGCGTITCNYDGKAKHQTIIEDGAFIGSNANLIAPVKVGKNSVIGAGSTISQDVPEEALGIARQRQKNILNWVKKGKSKK